MNPSARDRRYPKTGKQNSPISPVPISDEPGSFEPLTGSGRIFPGRAVLPGNPIRPFHRCVVYHSPYPVRPAPVRTGIPLLRVRTACFTLALGYIEPYSEEHIILPE